MWITSKKRPRTQRFVPTFPVQNLKKAVHAAAFLNLFHKLSDVVSLEAAALKRREHRERWDQIPHAAYSRQPFSVQDWRFGDRAELIG